MTKILLPKALPVEFCYCCFQFMCYASKMGAKIYLTASRLGAHRILIWQLIYYGVLKVCVF